MFKKIADILRPIDRLIIGYQLLMLMMALIFRANIAGWGLAAFRHGTVLLGVIGLRLAAERFGNKFTRLASDWYPIATLPLAYRWAGDFVHAIFPWNIDGLLNGIDTWLLGASPANLLQHFCSPWFSDLMQLSYCSFYALIAASCLTLYLAGKRREFGNLTLAIIISLYGTYLLFMFLPAHSPRFEFASLFRLNGGWLTKLISAWLKGAAYCGGAFPSGHAAASVAICAFMWRYIKYGAFPFFLVTLLLLLSTIYGGYHYLVDILAGFIHGILASWAAVSWNRNYMLSGNE
jgi:membrane-associated phospholipid phosphatase